MLHISKIFLYEISGTFAMAIGVIRTNSSMIYLSSLVDNSLGLCCITSKKELWAWFALLARQ